MLTLQKPRQQFRLEEGGEIDRLAPLAFRFDNRRYIGYRGDTLASALLANGVRLVGRSFKYHRPRGIYTDGSDEPNALVELRTGDRREPNTRATTIELFAGLEALSQNRWPGLQTDIMQVTSLFAPIIPAGFYYKTFMGMPGWRFYEHFIRRAAGLGRPTADPDPDHYDRMHAFCDVLVVGAGPAGLAAALAAGRAGARVMLLEETDAPGGRLRAERERLDGAPAREWVARTAGELEAMPDVTVLTRTTGFGYYDGTVISALERVADHKPVPDPFEVRQRIWHIRARRVVLATGASERPLVFAGNDRPGVMLAGAARSYVNRFAVRPGSRAAVFANNDDGYRTAIDLARAGIEVRAVIDCRAGGQGAGREQAAALGIECLDAAAVTATHGHFALTGIETARLSADGRGIIGEPRLHSVDLLAVSGGWSPNIQLHGHIGPAPAYDAELAGFVAGSGPGASRSAGAANGAWSLGECLRQGSEAGSEAARLLGFDAGAPPGLPVTEEAPVGPIRPMWRLPGRGKKFVDLQDDVTVDDIELAHREGYQSVEHLKRYTTLGMGTDQGRTSSVNGLAIMAEERGISITEAGIPRSRPPVVPVALGAIAAGDVGMHFAPKRRTPMHDWHEANGAVFDHAGHWLRPQYYLRPGEDAGDMNRAIAREVTGTRSAAGMVDVSTLGKIDIQGRDAAEFLNRVYINGWSTLPVGRARYGLMQREDGIVFDDGTTSRVGEHRYFMTTTTANAAAVMTHLEEYLALHWRDLDVTLASVTEQWGTLALAGPRSRDVLARVVDGLDVSDEGLPYMGVRDASIAGVAVRLFRISFSGELAYEVAAPADHAARVWEVLADAGAGHGLVPYGTEAMGIMRIEKGHVAGGELDGRTTAVDLGLGRMVSRRKFHIGHAMAGRDGLTAASRPGFVGLVPVDAVSRPLAGSILVADPQAQPPVDKLGHVSSSAWLSPSLPHPIALGFVRGGRERIGSTVWAMFPMRNEAIEVRVVDPVFLDPDGERLHG